MAELAGESYPESDPQIPSLTWIFCNGHSFILNNLLMIWPRNMVDWNSQRSVVEGGQLNRETCQCFEKRDSLCVDQVVALSLEDHMWPLFYNEDKI